MTAPRTDLASPGGAPDEGTDDERARASDPRTPADALRALAVRRVPELMRRVGGNPSAPLDLLMSVAVWMPDEVASNPSLELHVMARGIDFLEKNFPHARALIYCERGAWLRPLAARNAAMAVRAMVADCPGIDPALLAQLTDDPHPAVRLMTAKNPSCPPRSRARLLRDRDPGVQAEAARRHDLSTVDRLRLAIQGSRKFRLVLAEHPDTPPEVLRWLALNGSGIDVRQLAVAHPALPADALDVLAGARPPAHRALAAQSPRLPPATLRKLVHETSIAILVAVAGNPTTPADTLAELATHMAPPVRIAVALSPTIPLPLLLALRHDTSALVRDAVLRNPLAPLSMLTAAVDERTDVKLVARNPALPHALAATLLREHPSTHFDLLGNPSLPTELLMELANLKNYHIDMELARHPRSPAPLLERLAEDALPIVQRLVARPDLSDEMLARMRWHPEPKIALAIFYRQRLRAVAAER